MKCLLLPVLLMPSLAMASMVIVDDGAAPVQVQTSALARPSPAVPASESAVSQIQPAKSQSMQNPEPTPAIVRVWSASVGSTLRSSMQQWVDSVTPKWVLIWDAPDGPDKFVNYRIDAPLTFQGSIDTAAADCVRLYEKAKRPLQVDVNVQQRLLYVHLKYN